MATYFTADTHFGHAGMLDMCDRRRFFRSTAEMDKAMYENWAKTVKHNDTVYHLGDVAFGGKEAVADAARRIGALPGKKFLVPGNHDREYLELLARAFEVLPPLVQIIEPVGGKNTRIVLCHYPLWVWDDAHRGALHFHGHVHGRTEPNQLRIDVGVDDGRWCFTPVLLENIVERMKRCAPWQNPEKGRSS